MIIYRIASTNYIQDLTGTGAKLFGSRWNSVGIPMLYTGEHISLCLLEALVHVKHKQFLMQVSIIDIEVPAMDDMNEIKIAKLKKTWREDDTYTKFIGDEFVGSNNALLMKVPSAVVEEEHNFLINPLHADFKKIKIINNRIFKADKRLYSFEDK